MCSRSRCRCNREQLWMILASDEWLGSGGPTGDRRREKERSRVGRYSQRKQCSYRWFVGCQLHALILAARLLYWPVLQWHSAIPSVSIAHWPKCLMRVTISATHESRKLDFQFPPKGDMRGKKANLFGE